MGAAEKKMTEVSKVDRAKFAWWTKSWSRAGSVRPTAWSARSEADEDTGYLGSLAVKLLR